MAKVELRDVSKVFASGQSGSGKSDASHTAVDGVSLTVVDREFLVLLGPSGCGKSTTLRMIAGLDEPTSGRILIGDRVVNQVAPKDRDIAMVFQSYALYPHMNVYQNMAFGLELRFKTSRLKHALTRVLWPAAARAQAAKRAEIDRRVRSAARMLGIETLLARYPRQLSGGERQRVALGRAIVREPAAFLFDEPLSNLDAKLRGEMRREIKRLHQTLRTTVVYVTHDQIEALTLGDRVAVMNRGRVQQIGPPTDVYRHPANRFVAEFLGTPPMNVLSGQLERPAGGSLRFAADCGFELQLPAAAMSDETSGGLFALLPAGTNSARVDLGFRPEDVRLEPGSAGRSASAPADEAHFVAAHFAAIVTLTEPLGDSQLVHLAPQGSHTGAGTRSAAAKNAQEETSPAAEKSLLVCKANATTNYQPGDTITGYVTRGQLHFFDVQSGQSLDQRRSASAAAALAGTAAGLTPQADVSPHHRDKSPENS